jgi:hypothetical protein
MTQQSISELAKQGNPKAIAILINRSLQAKNITAKTSLKGECLRVKLESNQVPEQKAMVQIIQQGLTKLKPEFIKTVKIYGCQTDIDFPAWSQVVELETQTSLVTDKLPPAKLLGETKSEDLSNSLVNNEYPVLKDEVYPYYSASTVTAKIEQSKNNITGSEKSVKHYNNDLEAKLNAVGVPRKISKALFVSLWLLIGFDSLFVLYSIVWATYFYIYNLIDIADASGFFAYLINSLYTVVHYFWYLLEFITVWIYRITFVITLIWLHRLHSSLRITEGEYPISPWGAIARFAIPVYSLWGIWDIFATFANRLKSRGSELAGLGKAILKKWLPWFYIFLFSSNVLNQILWFQEKNNPQQEYSPWFFLAKTGASLFFSLVWLKLVILTNQALIKIVDNSSNILINDKGWIDKQREISDNKFNFKAVFYGMFLLFVGTNAANFFFYYFLDIFFSITGMKNQQSSPELQLSFYFFTNIVVSLIFTILGGFLAAYLAKKNKLKHALVMGFASVSLYIWLGLSLGRFSFIGWYYTIFLVLSIPAALLGGYLQQHQAKV